MQACSWYDSGVIGLDPYWIHCHCIGFGWIGSIESDGLMLVNPVESNCVKGTAGTWLRYITEVAIVGELVFNFVEDIVNFCFVRERRES